MPDQDSRSGKFNRITLQLKESKHMKPFYDFAMEDVLDIIPYFVLMSTLLFLAQVLFAVQKKEAGIALAYSTAEFLLYMSLIPLKNYLKHRIVYYMLVLSLFTLFGTYLQVVFEDKKRSADLEQGLEINELDIRAKYEYFMRTALFFILFACPSTKMFFAYLFNFVLFIFILSADKGNWGDDQFIEALA